MMSGNDIQKKIKILMVVNKLDITGISSVVMNYCSHMDLTQFTVEIAAGNPISETHRITCKNLGIVLRELPNRWKNSKGYYKELNRIIRDEKPDILHVHGNSATMSIELFLGWIHGVKVRIPHSHNTTCSHMILHKLLLPVFNRLYTHAFACGQKAGEWMYGNRSFYIIPNGFDTERFKYNVDERSRMRNQIGLDDAFVVGHIGRFNAQKNQTFLIRVFENFAKHRKDAVLLLIGIGPDFEKIKRIAGQSPVKNRIVLYGETKEPEKMYSAMDIFVLPSLYEGLPMALIEAQCSGLHCVISDTVTDEINMDNHVITRSLDTDGIQSWTDAIEMLPRGNRSCFYESHQKEILKYNIFYDVEQLERLYGTFVK